MKHKAWFRLIMRTSGLITMLIGAMMFADRAIDVTFDLFDHSDENAFSAYALRSFLYALTVTIAGAYLCFRGEWVIMHAFPSGPKCCPSCGYQVRGNETGICSECGAVLPPEFRVTNHE